MPILPKLPIKPIVPIAPILLAAFAAFTACSSPTPEELAALAAEGYYRHLVQGDYEHFLEGKAGSDSLPADYREQLLTGYRQFMAQQERAHGGIRDIRISSARHDTLADYTTVLLVLCFSDSTDEEIVVPMSCHDGRWRMR